MIPLYQGAGFEEIEYIEKGHNDEAMYFYGKKIDQNSNMPPPRHSEFKEALTAQRAREQNSI